MRPLASHGRTRPAGPRMPTGPPRQQRLDRWQTAEVICNALLLGYLMYRSGLVPRVIPVLGLIGGPLLISAVVGRLLGINETTSIWSMLGLAPIFIWELSLGLWMTIKGFRRPAGVTAAPVAQAA